MRQPKEIVTPLAGEALPYLGGTPGSWSQSGIEADITLLNRERHSHVGIGPPRMSYREGDAVAFP